MGARAALTGGGAALTALQVPLMESFRSGDFGKFVRLSGVCDRFASATFDPPVEGYVRRMLWALAADGVIPEDACDDPWGSSLPPAERDAVRDRKSTRLNSSHSQISYVVFCLNKSGFHFVAFF